MKRTFFHLVDDMERPGWHLDIVSNGNGEEPPLTSGRRYDGPLPLFTSVHRRGPALEYCRTSFAVPIASKAIGGAIAEVAGRDLQALPLVVDGRGDERLVLNAIRVVDCLDEPRSIFTKWEAKDGRPEMVGRYRMIMQLKVDAARIQVDAGFFRLGRFETALLVSGDVKRAIESLPHSGAIFLDVC